MNKKIPIKQPLPEIHLAINAALKAGEAVMEVYNQN